MSLQKTVTIIGGGIAGLSAAVFLNEKDFKVTLLEASPKSGGRAYSFFDKEKKQFFDNGQHILAGWYKNTFEYLKIIGSYDKLDFQNSLEINFINTEKKVYKFKCPDTAPPMNLLMGLLKFDGFNLRDKFALKNINNLFKSNNNYAEKYKNVNELLKGIKQTDKLIKYFWEPFNLAVFNTKPENINIEIFLNVLRLGFKEKVNSNLVIPKVNLNELLIDGALKYFEKNKVSVLLNKTVSKIMTNENENIIDKILCDDGDEIISDYYISAVPFFAFKKLFDENIYNKNNFKADNLKSSGIVSVHLFFENKIPMSVITDNSFGMTGLIGTTVQWIFKRNDYHLSLVVSGADELGIKEMSNEDIYNLCLKDLNSTIRGFEKLNISDYKVLKEKRATFMPDKESIAFRPKQKTKYKNLFIAGDWTDTGLPATIESAVSSSKICVEEICNS